MFLRTLCCFPVFVWGARALAHMHMREHMGERAVTTDQKPDYSGFCLESAQYLVAGMVCCSLSGTEVHFAQQPPLGTLALRAGWSVKASQGQGPLPSLDVTHGKRVTKLLLVHQRHCLSSKVSDLLPCELVSKDAGL